MQRWRYDDYGMVVIRGRLTPELGAVVQRALDAACDRLRREGQAAPSAGAASEDVTQAQRRADALGLLAEAALSADLDRGSAGDRYQVVLHIDSAADVAAGEPSDVPAREGVSGTLEVDHRAVDVAAETSRRISCDASLVPMRHADDGAVLDVGRKTRTVPPSIRRALLARDRTCQFPGCTSRRCDAHHIEHWLDGGPTSLDNLVLLCRRHHRSVHEGSIDVRLSADGSLAFIRQDGTVLQPVPYPPALFTRLEELPLSTDLPTWDGTPFNLAYAVDVLYSRDSDAKMATLDNQPILTDCPIP